jgi:glycerol-3-phosphate acyltransferase PlsY
MNALRLLGRRAGLAVMATDIGKGVAACLLGRALAGDSGAHTGGVAAVAGHCYPAWNGFRGGKGIAVSFGQCIATFPAYVTLDAAVAVGISRLPGLRRPALVSVGVSSTAWVLAGVVWWRRPLPNLWGVRPTALLPLANAATSAVIASKGLAARIRDEPDGLRLRR